MKPETCMSSLMIILAAILFCGVASSSVAAQTILYGTPSGAGARDGSSWENALPLDTATGLQDAWERLEDGGRLHIGSGEYRTPQSLSIAAGGSSSSKRKELTGVDTGGGFPVFRGAWAQGSKDDRALIRLKKGASFVLIENLEVHNYARVIHAEGRNFGYIVYNIDVHDTDYGFMLYAGATPEEPNSGSANILLENISIHRFARRGFRFEGGHHDVIVNNCVVDAGGKPNAHPDYGYPMGFQISKNTQHELIIDRDIVFNNCVANNAYNDRSPKYWQGDGFCSERPSRDITFNNCLAIGNTDGGWDVKSATIVLRDCVSIRNKRNFRFWSLENAVMENCFSGYPLNVGPGAGSPAGVHVNQNVPLTIVRSTIMGSPSAEILFLKGARVTVKDSIIVPNSPESAYRHDDSGGLNITGSAIRTSDSRDNAAELILENTTEYLPGVSGSDPQFQQPITEWNGLGEAYNSKHYGPAVGYFRQITVHMAGDSTMANPGDKNRPQTGWGEMLGELLQPNVRVRNHARGGRSTKSFIDEKLWEGLLAEARAGDFVVIQFGHNDQKADRPELSAPADTVYRANLERFITDCHKGGLHPILATSIHRRNFRENKIRNSLGDYPAVMRQVASTQRVTLADLHAASETLFNSMGEENTKALFNHLEPGEHPNHPDGKKDNTHFSDKGARVIAQLFLDSLANSKSPMLQLVRERSDTPTENSSPKPKD